MKKSSKLFSAILAVLLMVSALGTVPANAAEAEVTVNSLPELQEAIAAAVDGDTIHIAGDIVILLPQHFQPLPCRFHGCLLLLECGNIRLHFREFLDFLLHGFKLLHSLLKCLAIASAQFGV